MAKGKKNNKIPKKIGGLKVPKELRKGGESLLTLVNQPLAREIAVAAALAALAASKDAQKAAKKARADAGEAAEEVAEKVDWVGPAMAAAAAEVGRRLFDAYREKNAAPGQPGKTAKVIRIVEKLAAGNKL
jgi:hypothetical protein